MKSGIGIVLVCSFAAAVPLRAGVETDEPRPMEDRFFTVVLSEEERAVYEFLPDEEKGAFRRARWARLDPTPTTEINEREREHQRRVVAAIRRFREISGFFVWDDRARALVRFGEPLSVSAPDGGDGVLREIWFYGDFVFGFEARSGEGSYRQGIRISPSGRTAEGEAGTREAMDEAFRAEGLVPEEGRRLVGEGARLWDEVPERNGFAPETGRSVGFVHDYWAFPGADGKTDVLVALLVPDSASVRDGAPVIFRRRAAIRDSVLAIVARGEDTALRGGVGGDPAGGFVTVDTFSVAPGEYQLVLRLDEEGAGPREIRFTNIVVPDYGGPDIRVGGPVVAGKVTTSFRQKGLYERREHRIVPRPGGRFSRGETVHFYFEIGHVREDRDGRYYMEIDYRLEGPPGDWAASFGGTDGGKFEPGRIEKFASVLRGPGGGRHIALETAGLPAGAYALVLEARDLTSDRTDRVSADFTITE
ncbi:MAG: GWxTD domain-containing protein [Candidatus Eisenbacteria bacterium]